MNIQNLKITKRMVGLALTGTLCLTGCADEHYVVRQDDDYDVLDTNYDIDIDIDIDNDDNKDINNGLANIKQELDVNGEDFKLVIEYSCDDDWKITADKTLNMFISTKGLDNQKEVYIDTIHVDTSIVSSREELNGILQDTLDDHIHNSLLLGFPISDDNSYYGINKIEGQNDTFISGFFYGYKSFYGEVKEQRLTEEDYLRLGVWANRISGVVGLIIKDVETGKIRCVDVNTNLLVAVNNKVVYYNDGRYTTYQYDKYGKKTVVSSTDEKPKSLKKKKN